MHHGHGLTFLHENKSRNISIYLTYDNFSVLNYVILLLSVKYVCQTRVNNHIKMYAAHVLIIKLVLFQNGIAGPFWYAAGIMANIFVFPVLSVHFKTRAPGAKTYLQVMSLLSETILTLLLLTTTPVKSNRVSDPRCC